MNLRFLIIVGLVLQLFWLPTRVVCAEASTPTVQESSACGGCCKGCPSNEQPEPEREPCCASCPLCDLRTPERMIVPSERDAIGRRLLDPNDAPEITHVLLTRPVHTRVRIGAPQLEHPPPMRLDSSVSAILGRWLH